jgi:hypothetical protein
MRGELHLVQAEPRAVQVEPHPVRAEPVEAHACHNLWVPAPTAPRVRAEPHPVQTEPHPVRAELVEAQATQSAGASRQAVPGGGSRCRDRRWRADSAVLLGFGSRCRTHCAHCVRFVQTSCSEPVFEARCARRPEPCAARRARDRPHRVPPAAKTTVGARRPFDRLRVNGGGCVRRGPFDRLRVSGVGWCAPALRQAQGERLGAGRAQHFA